MKPPNIFEGFFKIIIIILLFAVRFLEQIMDSIQQ